MITVDLKTQDTQLNPKQNSMPEKTQDTQLNLEQNPMPKKTQDTQLNPKQNPMPKKTMTPRHKFKRIQKDGKIQKIQYPGVHRMKFNPSHKIAGSQNTLIKSPNISCDSTVPDTGIPKSNSSKMVLGVQDTKQNYKTKALKMSKGSMPQMHLVKRRKNVVRSRKFKLQGCIKSSSLN